MGHHLAQACMERRHELTLFHRGQTSVGAYPGVREVIGDREDGLAALDGETFDAAIDTCAYVPRVAEAAAKELKGRVGHYTFVSTVSIYADFSLPGLHEDSKVVRLEDETTEEVTGETYGGLKVLCERVVNEHLGDRTFHLRPGIIIGPNDPTDRFTYWVERMARGGEVLAPTPEDRTMQGIDARDLATFTLERIEAGFVGARNAAGPSTTFAGMLSACAEAAGESASIRWADSGRLQALEVQAPKELPFWLPMAEYAGFGKLDSSRARSEGLQYRPLVETARDTLAWLRTRPGTHEWLAGLPADREHDLLQQL